MQGWQTTYLGLRELPRELSAFELQAFFTFSPCRARTDRGAARQPAEAGPGAAHRLPAHERAAARRLSRHPIVLWRHLSPNSASPPRNSPPCARCMAAAAPCSITSRLPASPLDSDG